MVLLIKHQDPSSWIIMTIKIEHNNAIIPECLYYYKALTLYHNSGVLSWNATFLIAYILPSNLWRAWMKNIEITHLNIYGNVMI